MSSSVRLRILCASALYVVLIASPAYAQGRVTGTVKGLDDKPIKGAIVTAENPDASAHSLTTTSNAKGKYAFLGLRGGAWTFTAEAPGFLAMQRRMDVRMLGANAAVDFQLQTMTGGRVGPTATLDFAAEQRRLAAADEMQRAGKLDEAIAAYRDILARTPALTRVHLELGILFERKHDTANAISEYQAALKADPADAKARAALERLTRE
jgi:tetratricopeptide (TPR) repeat protein